MSEHWLCAKMRGLGFPDAAVMEDGVLVVRHPDPRMVPLRITRGVLPWERVPLANQAADYIEAWADASET